MDFSKKFGAPASAGVLFWEKLPFQPLFWEIQAGKNL
jgi:hypothetical protein